MTPIINGNREDNSYKILKEATETNEEDEEDFIERMDNDGIGEYENDDLEDDIDDVDDDETSDSFDSG